MSVSLFGSESYQNDSDARNSKNAQKDDIQFLKEDGYRVSWSSSKNLILYDQRQSDGYFDIYVMTPDGSQEQCLTNVTTIPEGHKGCAEWHPSGEYIVFTCQKEYYFGKHIPFLRTSLDKLAVPGEGVNCDLWLMNAKGTQFWQLTDLPTKTHFLDKQAYTGVLHPHFSQDGTKLFWSERNDNADNKWGEWTLNIAEFHIENDTPQLTNIIMYQPGNVPCFYESHGFSSDDAFIVFSGNLESEQDENHLDIYLMNISTEEIIRLTNDTEQWDEHAHFSPEGERIIWMSSNDYGMNTQRKWWDHLRTDYWMMNPDGSQKTKITFYNEQLTGYERIICSDRSFNPDGTKLATTLLCINGSLERAGIVLLDLKVTDGLSCSDTSMI